MSKTDINLTIDSLERDLGQKFAYPASTKSFLIGSRPDIRAPYRLIEQTPTKTSTGAVLENPPFRFTIPQGLIVTQRF